MSSKSEGRMAINYGQLEKQKNGKEKKRRTKRDETKNWSPNPSPSPSISRASPLTSPCRILDPYL